MQFFRSTDPFSGALLADWPIDDADGIGYALDNAANAARRLADTELDTRVAWLRTLAGVLRARAPQLAAQICAEIGRPLAACEAEVRKCAQTCDWYAEFGPAMLADRPVSLPDADGRPVTAHVRLQPLGPVLLVMPWNFPLWQVLRCGVPALLAGNPLVLKHAPNVQGCASALVDCVQTAIPIPGAIANVRVATDQIGAIVADPRIAAVSVTGSVGAGRAMALHAAAALKPAVLELGGSDPFLVLDDADVPLAVELAVASRFQNAGQSCIAAKRLIVHAGVGTAFLDALCAAVNALRVGDPRDPQTQLGPLARPDLADALDRQWVLAEKQGAILLTQRTVLTGHPCLRNPAVFLEPIGGTVLWEDETFGPVLPIRIVASDDEAILWAAHPRYGLGATICTADPARADRIGRRLRVGALFVNQLVRSDPRLPFGGVGDSGWGRELGEEGLRAFCNVQTVVSSM